MVESNTLKVRQKKLPHIRNYDYEANNLTIIITNATFDAINLSGSFNVEAPEKITVAKTDIHISGSGNISFDNYDLKLTGSGTIKYKKTNATVDSKSTGSGNIEMVNW